MNLRRFAASPAPRLKIMLRNRVALFWSFVFPIILMTMLGLLFGGNPSAGTITVVDDAHRRRRRRDGAHARTARRGQGQARERHRDGRQQVRDGDREAALVLTTGRIGVTAHLTTPTPRPTRPGSSGASSGRGRQRLDRRHRPAAGDQLQPGLGRLIGSLDYIDFLLPGIIAIAIMISGVFGLSTVLVTGASAASCAG